MSTFFLILLHSIYYIQLRLILTLLFSYIIRPILLRVTVCNECAKCSCEKPIFNCVSCLQKKKEKSVWELQHLRNIYRTEKMTIEIPPPPHKKQQPKNKNVNKCGESMITSLRHMVTWLGSRGINIKGAQFKKKTSLLFLWLTHTN